MCFQIHRFSCAHVEQKPILCKRYKGIQGKWNRLVGRIAHTWAEDCGELSRFIMYQTLACHACRNRAAAEEQARGYKDWMTPAQSSGSSAVRQTQTQTQAQAQAAETQKPDAADSSQAGSDHTQEPATRQVKPTLPKQKRQE